MVYLLCKILLTIPFFLLYRPYVRGWRNLWFRGPAIVISNHHHLTDPIMIGFVTPRIMHFMAKKELFEKPATRWFLTKCFFAFPVDRSHVDIASMKKAMSVLEAGRVFGIFPEGSRSVSGNIDDFERGAAFLALRAKVKVIPIYADPTARKRLRVRMNVGEPIDPAAIAAQSDGKAVDVVTEVFRDSILRLRNELESKG